jgi:hypothetical protein
MITAAYVTIRVSGSRFYGRAFKFGGPMAEAERRLVEPALIEHVKLEAVERGYAPDGGDYSIQWVEDHHSDDA